MEAISETAQEFYDRIEAELSSAQYSLTDMIEREALEEILDAFTAATGFASTIGLPDGTPITHYSNFCELCRITRSTEAGRRNCYHSASVLGRRAIESGRVVFHRCLSAGLLDAAAPIIVHGRHIANWLVGQVLVGDVDEAHFREYARKIGADEEEYIAALRRVPRKTEEETQKMAEFLAILARNLSEMGFRRLVDMKLRERLQESFEAEQKALREREQLQQEIIEAQQRALRELSTPIIPLFEGIIVMPLIGSIDTLRARDITRSLLAGIREYRARVVILDITGVPLVDSGVAAHLNKTIQAARLKGAQTIVTGVSDAVAETVVEMGIDWSGIETLSDLQSGLQSALRKLGLQIGRLTA
jgi:ligand-binding sensor protein/anti-anti-sigma regulatory factor